MSAAECVSGPQSVKLDHLRRSKSLERIGASKVLKLPGFKAKLFTTTVKNPDYYCAQSKDGVLFFTVRVVSKRMVRLTRRNLEVKLHMFTLRCAAL